MSPVRDSLIISLRWEGPSHHVKSPGPQQNVWSAPVPFFFGSVGLLSISSISESLCLSHSKSTSACSSVAEIKLLLKSDIIHSVFFPPVFHQCVQLLWFLYKTSDQKFIPVFLGELYENIIETFLTMIKWATYPSNTISLIVFNGEYQYTSFFLPDKRNLLFSTIQIQFTWLFNVNKRREKSS